MFGLIDCNNFYASCERVFNPKLNGKPVIVLSNNDGCVIARSDEAKALGIKMGQPFFEVKRHCVANGVYVFSSNYTLYGDMSSRVMSILEANWPEVEVYSIDEAFLHFKGLSPERVELLGYELHHKVKQYTGIPVSVGVGPTKTLAKLANHIAKREVRLPFFDISEKRFWLAQLPIEEVWGIGRKLTQKLNRMGVQTVEDLANLDAMSMRRKFNITVSRTILELQGHACLSLEEIADKKGIMSSKSFGAMQTSFDSVSQALANFCARSSEKLRKQNSLAGRVSVFVRTNPFRSELPQYNVSTDVNLVQPTNDVRVITHWARLCLKQIFKEGYQYKKVGVYLDEITPNTHLQTDLFSPTTDELNQRSKELMTMLDKVNARYGQGTLKIAAEGFQKSWDMKQRLKSPCYTTRWSELAQVRLG